MVTGFEWNDFAAGVQITVVFSAALVVVTLVRVFVESLLRLAR